MEFTVSIRDRQEADGPYMYGTNDFFKHDGKVYRGRINSYKGSVESLTLKTLTPDESKWLADRGLFKDCIFAE